MFFNLFKKNNQKPRETLDGLRKGDKFHFIAMGGVGQSALAKILIKLGYEVSGSDIRESKYLNELKELGAKVSIGHDAKNVPEGAIVVLSSAIKEDNPELMRAKELGLLTVHRSDLLLAITYEFALTIGFAGTHGKTTTSGLASYLLSRAGKKPAFAVGGIIPNLHTNADADKNSDTFVAELDESDGTIIKYTPEILVINNLEADHPDFYKNGLSDVLDLFKDLIEKQPDDAKIIVNANNDGILSLLDTLENKTQIVKFGILSDDIEGSSVNNGGPLDYLAKNINFTAEGAEFDLYMKGKFHGKIQTGLKGEHNVYNVLAVIAALVEAGVDLNEFNDFIKEFSGMGRRFQQVYKNENVEIIDDYAHHPSEIKATLKAACAYKTGAQKKRVVAIFQPHRYTRFKGLWEEFLHAFNDCDELIVTDVFTAGDTPDPEFNSKNFVEKIKTMPEFENKPVCHISGKITEISDEVLKHILKDDLILTLGAGDITKMGHLLEEKL